MKTNICVVKSSRKSWFHAHLEYLRDPNVRCDTQVGKRCLKGRAVLHIFAASLVQVQALWSPASVVMKV